MRIKPKVLLLQSANKLISIFGYKLVQSNSLAALDRQLSAYQSTLSPEAALALKQLDYGCTILEYAILDYPKNSEKSTLFLTHNSGLFSCLNTFIFSCIELSRLGLAPVAINNAFSMNHFKRRSYCNSWNDLFQLPTLDAVSDYLKVSPARPFRFDHHGDYHDLFANHLGSEWVASFFTTYFSPTREIDQRARRFAAHLQISQSPVVAVCIRGTDKWIEVSQDPIELYFDKVDCILADVPSAQIAIQTDQLQVRTAFVERYGDQCSFIPDLPVTSGVHVMHSSDELCGDRHEFCLNLIAAVFALSKADYVITHTGNIGCFLSLLALMQDKQLIQLS